MSPRKLVVSTVLSLTFITACGSDDTVQESSNQPPTIRILNTSCSTSLIDNTCRDIGLLIINLTANDQDNESLTISGNISSASLSESRNISAEADYWQVDLNGFGGVSDLILTVTATDPSGATGRSEINVGVIDENQPPVCSDISPVQDYINDQPASTIELIDPSRCEDPELDQFELLNNTLDITLDGDYSQTVTVIDDYAAQTSYNFSGTISPRDLTVDEVSSELIRSPDAIGATDCFTPINPIYDEIVVCDFAGEWLGIQYDSLIDTSGFDNVAPASSAQGFSNLPSGTSLIEILQGYSRPSLPDNQVVNNPGSNDIAITATIDRDPTGGYSNFNLSASSFNLEGASSENSIISCENGTYSLPVSQVTGTRGSSHTIDQNFVETIGSSIRISNCIATNQNGLTTLLEGDIDITVNQVTNNNPIINSFSGISSGFEGVRTIIANVTDVDSNLDRVTLRYRIAGSIAAWTEVQLPNIATTDNFQNTVSFAYQSNLDDSGLIEYQLLADDTLGGRATSAVSSVSFNAIEATAQAIIEDEVTNDPLKIVNCFDCTILDATGNVLGPFDAVFADASGNNQVYEYNGEGRSAADMTNIANSLTMNGYSFYEIPISTVAVMRANIQAN